jgi:formate-dependent nitrite reductase membrane component NrfD
MAEHFVRPPHWEWYILGYFFLAGLTGGCYALGTMLRLWGGPRGAAAARVAFLAAFPLFLLCPVLLTVDLGQPLRFWHMLVSTTPGQAGLGFKYWSPMSIGSWVLAAYGLFTFVSFLEALALGRSAPGAPPAGLPHALAGGIGRLFNVVGALLGLFVASYTGVLLSVSNQPVWSDTWTLGGLFLASGLSASAALLAGLVHGRKDAAPTEPQLRQADGYFALLELVLIVLFLATLASAGTVSAVLAAPWLVLWLLVVVGLIPPLAELTHQKIPLRGAGVVAIVALVGTLALRAIVLLSAQS